MTTPTATRSLSPPAAAELSNDLLNELSTEFPTEPQLRRPVIKKLNYSHDGMIDLLIASPGISQNELAANFGYSATWVCQVLASDAFQSRFAERKKEIVDPALQLTVEQQFKAVVLRSLEILSDKLAKPSHQVPDVLVIRSLEVAAKAAGYGVDKNPYRPTTGETHNHLHLHAENLVSLLKKTKTDLGLVSEVPANGQ